MAQVCALALDLRPITLLRYLLVCIASCQILRATCLGAQRARLLEAAVDGLERGAWAEAGRAAAARPAAEAAAGTGTGRAAAALG